MQSVPDRSESLEVMLTLEVYVSDFLEMVVLDCDTRSNDSQELLFDAGTGGSWMPPFAVQGS